LAITIESPISPAFVFEVKLNVKVVSKVWFNEDRI
jgi:hypothetical protein